MARIKYGSLVTEIVGSIGGQTFQKCRGGFIVRNKPRSPFRRSEAQSRGRTAIAQLSQAWRVLTPVNRASWESVAPSWPKTDKFGDPYIMSGYECFIHANLFLVGTPSSYNQVGQLPSVLTPIQSLEVNVSAFGGPFELSWNGVLNSAELLLVGATAPMSQGRGLRLSEMTILDLFSPVGIPPIDLTSVYVDKFGKKPSIGSKIFVSAQVMNINTGSRSQLYTASAIAVF